MTRLLDGKVAVITGASSGLGRAMAINFAAEGAAVVIGDVREDPLEGGEGTVQLIARSGGDALFVRTDVAIWKDIDALVSTAVDRHGRLDVMVNNAGVWPGFATVLDEREADFDRVLAINLKGVYFGCRQAIEQMRRQGGGGRIVNISSIAGLIGLPREPAYSASKAALIGLTRQIAVDFGPDGIAVNVVCPGFLATALSRTTLGANPVHSLTPWPRMGTAEDAAEAAVFLASDAAAFINGAVLAVDGGYTAR